MCNEPQAVLLRSRCLQGMLTGSAHYNLQACDACGGVLAAGTLALSGSIDGTARLYDVRSGRCLSVKSNHTDEVLDVAFNTTGSSFVTASADGTARLVANGQGGCCRQQFCTFCHARLQICLRVHYAQCVTHAQPLAVLHAAADM